MVDAVATPLAPSTPTIRVARAGVTQQALANVPTNAAPNPTVVAVSATSGRLIIGRSSLIRDLPLHVALTWRPRRVESNPLTAIPPSFRSPDTSDSIARCH